jgi:hypothetical protein
MTSEEQWEDVELPDIIKFDTDGDTMEGTFTGTEHIPYDEGFDTYNFMRRDGSYWSTAASGGLRAAMKQVSPGTYVKLTRTGTQDTGKSSPMVTFRVQTLKR